jgi:type VII secretion protein EssA
MTKKLLTVATSLISFGLLTGQVFAESGDLTIDPDVIQRQTLDTSTQENIETTVAPDLFLDKRTETNDQLEKSSSADVSKMDGQLFVTSLGVTNTPTNKVDGQLFHDSYKPTTQGNGAVASAYQLPSWVTPVVIGLSMLLLTAFGVVIGRRFATQINKIGRKQGE